MKIIIKGYIVETFQVIFDCVFFSIDKPWIIYHFGGNNVFQSKGSPEFSHLFSLSFQIKLDKETRDFNHRCSVAKQTLDKPNITLFLG